MHSSRRSGFLGKATPRPCHRHPTRGTSAVTGVLRSEPPLENLLRWVIRITGCQPRATISWYNQRAYRPRSVITSTVWPGPTKPAKARSKAIHSGFQGCGTLACRTFQATGMAWPR